MQTLPEELQMVILNYIGITKCRDQQNHELIYKNVWLDRTKNYRVLQVAREYALAIHRTTMMENFNKMKMTKIRAVIKSMWSWLDISYGRDYDIAFKFNSKVNFIKSLADVYDNSNLEGLELVLLLASGR